MARQTMKKGSRRGAFPKRLQRVQNEVERAISRGYHVALEALPPGTRKAVKDLAGQFEVTAEQVTERGERVLKLAQKRRKALIARVERAAKAFERRSERAVARSTKLIASFEQAAAEAVRPLARRLDIAALSDVEQLSKRLSQVERKLANGTRRAAA
jgi:hypothetical protein